MPRCFIALPVGEKAQRDIINIQNDIKVLNKKAHIKFIPSELTHVTLVFLGDLGVEQIDIVKDILTNLANKYTPFYFALKEVDAFPNLNNPQVLIIKVEEERRIGNLLEEDLKKSLLKIGLIKKDFLWRPHITIGRIKGDMRLITVPKSPLPADAWLVNRIILYQSDVSHTIPIYTVLGEYSLNVI